MQYLLTDCHAYTYCTMTTRELQRLMFIYFKLLLYNICADMHWTKARSAVTGADYGFCDYVLWWYQLVNLKSETRLLRYELMSCG